MGLIVTIINLTWEYSIFGMVIGMALPGIGVFLSFIYVLLTILIIYWLFKNSLWKSIVTALICVFLVTCALFPFIAIPSEINNAEMRMKDAYPTTYHTLTPKPRFLKTPFSYRTYFSQMKVPEDLVEIKTDIPYHSNENDTLNFDFYKPKSGTGPFPVVITIHGGAWVMGDKGEMNNPGFSKWLASQGYVVFDIEYGLVDIEEVGTHIGLGELASSTSGFTQVINPYNGSYHIPEQVANIGMFTRYLAENVETYNADLSRVFILGRSAGGHLAGVVGTGYNNPLFEGVFDPKITLKGIVLFYPPTNMSEMRADTANGKLLAIPMIAPAFDVFMFDPSNPTSDLADNYKKYSASYLIENDTVNIPPIIILHGDNDGIVPYVKQGLGFYNLAQSHNRTCVLVTIPGAGHAFDSLLSTPGGQISTYYVERFLALESK